jgi:uncharacterized protein YnzC (UPF0291/DUF896 family)
MENKIGYIYDGYSKKIEEIKYFDYLLEYGGQDETPSGVIFEEGTQYDEEEKEPDHWYHVVYSRHDNRKISSKSIPYNTEEEAQEAFYKGLEWYIDEKNWDAPQFHSTKEEAIQDFADGKEVSFEVAKRYFTWKEGYQEREKERQAILHKEYIAEKEALKAKMVKEILGLEVDSQLKEDITNARLLKGQEKSKAIGIAFGAYLKRTEKTVSDFWGAWRLISNAV